MAKYSKCVVDRKEIKQRNFAESDTKHFVRSLDKNAENSIFGTHYEKDIMLGIAAGARKKREVPYAVDGSHQNYNWNT